MNELKRPYFPVIGLCGLGVLGAAKARAADIFSADFESPGYQSGAYPAANSDSGGIYPDTGNGVYQKPVGHSGPYFDQLGFTGGQPGNDGFANDAFVIQDPKTAANHVAAFVGDSSQGPIHSSAVGVSLGLLNTTRDLTISQQAYYPSNIGNSSNRELVTGNNQAGGGLPTLDFGEGGYFNKGVSDGTLVWDFNNSVNSPALTADAWHTAVATIHFNQSNLADSTADFSVDGAVVQNGIPYDASALSNNAYYFAYTDDYPVQAGTGAIYLDNLAITSADAPEPATMVLMGLGATGLLSRRRHKK